MQIFISCERQDRGFANRLGKDLRRAGADVSVSTLSLVDAVFGYDLKYDRDGLGGPEQKLVERRMAYHWLVGVLSPFAFKESIFTGAGYVFVSHVVHEINASRRSPSASIALIDALPYDKGNLQDEWRTLPRFDATHDYQEAFAKLVQHIGLVMPQAPHSSAGRQVPSTPVSPAHRATMVTNGTFTVFVSYSHQDDTFARRLISDLHAQGIGVWIDHERLTPGTADWDHEIRRGISAAKGVVYVASKDAAASPYVGDELAVARDNHVVVYPLWARGDKWSSCAPLGWGRTQYIDAREGKYEAAVRALVASIRGSAGQ